MERQMFLHFHLMPLVRLPLVDTQQVVLFGLKTIRVDGLQLLSTLAIIRLLINIIEAMNR